MLKKRNKVMSNNVLTANNLDLLADYIDANVAQFQLNMRSYRSDKGLGGVQFRSFDECGTAGCAQGWSPFVFEPLESEFKVSGVLSFELHGARVFPSLYTKDNYSPYTNHHWHDIFTYNLSSDKGEVVGRLRDKAKELRGTNNG